MLVWEARGGEFYACWGWHRRRLGRKCNGPWLDEEVDEEVDEEEGRRSFMEETFLADRVTSLERYMEVEGERIMKCAPPKELEGRYSG